MDLILYLLSSTIDHLPHLTYLQRSKKGGLATLPKFREEKLFNHKFLRKWGFQKHLPLLLHTSKILLLTSGEGLSSLKKNNIFLT